MKTPLAPLSSTAHPTAATALIIPRVPRHASDCTMRKTAPMTHATVDATRAKSIAMLDLAGIAVVWRKSRDGMCAKTETR